MAFVRFQMVQKIVFCFALLLLWGCTLQKSPPVPAKISKRSTASEADFSQFHKNWLGTDRAIEFSNIFGPQSFLGQILSEESCKKELNKNKKFFQVYNIFQRQFQSLKKMSNEPLSSTDGSPCLRPQELLEMANQKALYYYEGLYKMTLGQSPWSSSEVQCCNPTEKSQSAKILKVWNHNICPENGTYSTKLHRFFAQHFYWVLKESSVVKNFPPESCQPL